MRIDQPVVFSVIIVESGLSHASYTHVSVDLYCQVEFKVEFSWLWPSCLFLELPLCNTDMYLDTEPLDPTVETLPIISDILVDSFSGIRLIHHNCYQNLLMFVSAYMCMYVL